jgi:hypothetical protein
MSGPEQLEILEPLGVDQGTFVARDMSTGSPELVVVERVTRASPVPAARAELLRRGRALKGLEHPKVVRVHDVFERDGEVLVVSDYIDGEWLSSLLMMEPRPPLGIMLRIVLDILEGLGALHSLRDEREEPMGFVHGALAPDTVLVAADGVAEIARACRLPRPGPNERYVAPELRRGDEPPEVRCDIYAAGAILRDVLVDAPPDVTWAEPLTEIAWRACSVDPENRWPSALAMATTVRRIAGSRLASAATVAEFVRRRFGEKMRARRAALQALGAHDAAPPSSEPLSLNPSEMELLDPSSAPTLVETQPFPPPVEPKAAAVPLARVALVKRPALILAEDEPEPSPRPQAVSAPPARPAPTPPPPAPAPVQPSLPPPTIVPDGPLHERPAEQPAVLEAYRRQMPTFPTYEPVVSRRRSAIRGMMVAAAIGLTFVLGWWLGRKYAPGAETAQPTPVDLRGHPVPTVTVAATPAPSIPPVSAVTSATATATATPTATPTPTPTPPPWAVTPHPAPTSTGPAVAPKPAPTATQTAAPKPTATHGNYNPEEL